MTASSTDVLAQLARHGKAVEAYMRNALERQADAPRVRNR